MMFKTLTHTFPLILLSNFTAFNLYIPCRNCLYHLQYHTNIALFYFTILLRQKASRRKFFAKLQLFFHSLLIIKHTYYSCFIMLTFLISILFISLHSNAFSAVSSMSSNMIFPSLCSGNPLICIPSLAFFPFILRISIF